MRLFIPILMLCSLYLAAQDKKAFIADEFNKIVDASSSVTKLAGDMKFTEGPVWYNGFLVFSDIPSNELKKWHNGKLTTFSNPSFNANGNCIDAEGRLITCEHGSRRVRRLEKNGVYTVLVERYKRRRLNSPNDVAVHKDGSIWFTDPTYGLKGKKKEQKGNYVYRFDPKTKKITALIEDFDMPNGICFSPDWKKVYVADSGKPKHIRVFEINDDGSLSAGKVFATIDKGAPDGICCDDDGRLYSTAGDGVRIYQTDGKEIGRILTPEAAANLCFGGDDRKTVFITARKSLYSIKLKVSGPY